MSDDDLIRRGDVLKLLADGCYDPGIVRSIAALTTVTVGVKPLVWEGEGHWSVGDNEGWLEEANTPFGWGYAIEFGDNDTGPWIVSSTFAETLTGFEYPDAAKAAAQADYEARILASLEPSTIKKTEMKLEAGKYYVLKSGQVVGPMFEEVGEEETLYMSNDIVDGYLPVWKEDGSADFFMYSKNYPDHNVQEEYEKV